MPDEELLELLFAEKELDEKRERLGYGDDEVEDPELEYGSEFLGTFTPAINTDPDAPSSGSFWVNNDGILNWIPRPDFDRPISDAITASDVAAVNELAESRLAPLDSSLQPCYDVRKLHSHFVTICLSRSCRGSICNIFPMIRKSTYFSMFNINQYR